ncbi:O-antigen ligase family protein [Dysosmobacter sp.]|uniref:O-antigen ligase family protein n=1 Tax=Dysosmobacter sp. TaxID=2591382 RepID=UPI002A887702|nr:O-antigen ligase family protein [Dysosmobacter sp.]MDY3281677.1 O-antigen ligase family protein [Dysosmobacter sp.]
MKENTRSAMDRIGTVVLPLMMFLVLTDVNRIVTLVAALAALVFVLGRKPQMEQRMAPLTVGVLLYGAVCLCSGLGSSFGDYAVQESCKILAAFSVFLLVLVRAPGTRRLLAWFTGCAAIIAFLCIEGSSTNVVTPLFNMARQLIGYDTTVYTGYEAGVRITGIYGNANVSAGLLGVALLAALYLVQTQEDRKSWKALPAYLALGMEALAFLLSFSMGAMATFFVTCLLYVAVSRKEHQLPLFILMVETAVVTVVCAFGATVGLGKEGSAAAAVPVVLSAVCGAVIWVLDRFAGLALGERLREHGKAALVGIGGFAAVLAVYVALAVNITGGTALTAGETLSRAVYLAPGSYAVTAEGADAAVRIYSQNSKDLMMHTETTVYEGGLAGAEFTVPEDSEVVWFQMKGEGALNRVTLSDGTALKLGYRLLPGFAANRIQGLRTNQNFIQRMVFWQDGIRLWKLRPVTGWGLGGVEGRVTAVQDFYYESKYVHNHFIQVMAESGIVGLAAFLFLLGSAYWTVVRRRSRSGDPVYAALFACLMMMTFHSMVEVVWSHQEYQTAVMIVLAAICMVPDCREHVKKTARWAVRTVTAALAAVTAVFGVLSGANLYAKYQMIVFGTSSASEFIAKAQQLDRIDVYDADDYKVAIIKTALQYGDREDYDLAGDCAVALRERKEFTACRSVAVYYDIPFRAIEDFFRDCRLGIEQEASSSWAWNRLIYTYRWAAKQLGPEDVSAFVDGVVETGDYLEAFNEGRMGPIELDYQEEEFISLCRALQGRRESVIYSTLQKYLEDATF